jgi:hypothetical protein
VSLACFGLGRDLLERQPADGLEPVDHAGDVDQAVDLPVGGDDRLR